MFTKRHTRQRLVVAALTFAALLMGALLLRTELVDTTLQSIVYDKAIDIGNPPLANQVTIIALDDQTVDQYRYPLPHQAYTDLLRALKPQNPSVIGTGLVEVPSIGYVVMAVFWWIILQGYMLVEEQITVARTRNTFGRFVTPSVARTIIDREEAGKLALGGEEKRVTVLFGDIRGFTTISEGLTPGILLGHLNRYFDGMVDIVNRYEGTVNKYNGDNIMVLWGAPLEVKDQARKAVECALEMQRWIVSERENGGPDVSFGFGINTGPVVAGFLGAKGRMEYTVIGDTANVASRLTSADIARRDQVTISGETLSEIGDDVEAVDVGAVLVKGRTGPVPCWQINRLGQVATPKPAPAPDLPIGRAVIAGYH